MRQTVNSETLVLAKPNSPVSRRVGRFGSGRVKSDQITSCSQCVRSQCVQHRVTHALKDTESTCQNLTHCLQKKQVWPRFSWQNQTWLHIKKLGCLFFEASQKDSQSVP